MNAREEILSRLPVRDRPLDLPGPWRSRRDFPDLRERFAQALNAAGGEVWLEKKFEQAVSRLGSLLEELHAQRVIVNGDRLLRSVQWPARFPAIEWLLVGQNPGSLREFCAMAEVGVSGVTAALAETGSLIVASGSRLSRMATLLPPVHIALIPDSSLTPDIFTWTAARQGLLPASVTLISGPSKTGDIEQTMAVGVHGPGRLIGILYQA